MINYETMMKELNNMYRETMDSLHEARRSIEHDKIYLATLRDTQTHDTLYYATLNG